MKMKMAVSSEMAPCMLVQ